MTKSRVIWIAVAAAVVYAATMIFVFSNFDLPEMSPSGWAIVGAAALAQVAAKWFFGLLFKESVEETGQDLPAYSAFKAALVGAGAARLIPAGGAITPVAMSWTVRGELDGKGMGTGPAVRTVLLNYAGLLIFAGGGLLLARPRDGAQVASVSLVVAAPFVLAFGLLLMFGSGKLGALVKLIPEKWKRRWASSVIDHLPGVQSQVYLWARLALEAAALGLVLHAFGIDVTWVQVIAAFGVSQLVGGLPGTPGGIGITEVGLVAVLTAYGFPSATTVGPVLIFRIISYWLPAALSVWAGGMTFLSSEEAQAAADKPA